MNRSVSLVSLIDRDTPDISISRQCELLNLARSNVYYKSVLPSSDELERMSALDKIYTQFPFYGSRRLAFALTQSGFPTCRSHVQRLMKQMGIEAIYPKPKLSKPSKDDIRFPYLLKDFPIVYPNQVWCSDITYIPNRHGFFYLTAVMDWFSRRVLSWQLSNTLDVDFCIVALEIAFTKYGRPLIFNTDQGSQFTSEAYTNFLLEHQVRISRDGRGRCFDNIMVERLWRTVKYEYIYLHELSDGKSLQSGLETYFTWYNESRPHSSLENQTPIQVYQSKVLESPAGEFF